MSWWTILDANGRRARIEANDITTRRDGSLLLLREDGNSHPIRLVPVFVLSRGAWHSAWIDGAEVDWSCSPESAPEPEPAPPRLLSNVIDDDVFSASRRAAVADRLAALPDTWEENNDR